MFRHQKLCGQSGHRHLQRCAEDGLAEGVSGQTESGARTDCQAGESAVFKLPPKRNGKVMESTRGNFHVGN